MKTKEIDVLINPSDLTRRFIYAYIPEHYPGISTDYLKAKLIIELPEKKITITEKEFESAFNKASLLSLDDNYKPKHYAYLGPLKQKLFGD